MDSLDHEILAAIKRNEQDLKQMLAGAGGEFEEALHLLHEVQQVKMEFASMKKMSGRAGAPAKTLRKKTRKSKSKTKTKKRDKKTIRMSQLTSTLVSLSLK